MQLLLSAVLLMGQGELDTYHLSIDPEFLDSLYADSLADLTFPAMVETPAGACSCQAGFRGGTSLYCPKKSWKLELADPELEGASHILLDAQYRDMSLMRNVLGLHITEELGRPAPMTEHVEFFINDVYYGVYVKVERIDDYFFDRTGTGYGPLFKSIDHSGRFAWQPCDTIGTTGFTSERGSDEYLKYVRQLIDAVNLSSPLEINIEDFIAYTAASIAMRDEDAITKNFYLHLASGGEWRFYPWDRDATFGNRWNGEYQPEWIESTTMYCLEISALAARLLQQDSSRELLAYYLNQTSYIMENNLPSLIDSIYLEIRESVYADTMKQGSNSDFDDAVALLREAVIQRGQFIPQIADGYQASRVVAMSLSQWDFGQGGNSDSITVSVVMDEPVTSATLYFWGNEEDVEYIGMYSTGPDGYTWERTVAFPDEYHNLMFSVKSISLTPFGESNCYFYYPLYGPPVTPDRRVSAPAARRSSFEFIPSDLVPCAPVRFTPDLWSLPLVNSSGSTQDISFCGFQVGDPPARLYTSEDVFLPPGDTLYLTNSCSLLKTIILDDEIILGNLAVDSPAGTELLFLNPAWDTAGAVPIADEVQCGDTEASVILSEICFTGSSGDWIELFNINPVPADVSGFVLMDCQLNTFCFPQGTVIDPGDFLVVCEDRTRFQAVNGNEINLIEELGFGLNSISDGLFLFDGAHRIFSVIYSRGIWPMQDSCVLSLASFDLPISIPSSWESIRLPGTPGEPNPGWPTIVFNPVIIGLWPNPVTSGFFIDFTMPVSEGELLLYDISGRMVLQPIPLFSREGSEYLNIPSLLAPGVYFAVVRSRGTFASRKLVVLP